MEDLRDALHPSILERYEGLEEIGRGGMGQVFRAVDRELDRPVAIKVLQAADFGGGKARLRFLEEGRICSQLVHPNIVRLYDFGAPEGPYAPFMIFEFIEGRSLDRLLDAGGYTADQALDLLDGIAAGLSCAHDAGITHRDLKPDNILLQDDALPKVADFGLAKDPQSSSGIRTRQGILLGTPPYMAPEYIRGERIEPPADMYALGVIAYRLLAGRLPFDSEDNVELLRMHVKSPVPDPRRDNPRLCDALADVLTGCLAKKPQERLPDMETFRRRLAAARKEQDAYADPSLGLVGTPGPRGDATRAVGDRDRRFRVPAPGPDSEAFRRRRAAALGITALIAVGLGAAHGVSEWLAPTATRLEVVVGHTSLEARWEGRGSTRLRLRPLGGPGEGPPTVRPLEGGPGRGGAATGLTPGREYLVEVLSGWTGRVLQSRTVRTEPAAPDPTLRVTLEGRPPRPVLVAEGERPFGLSWRLEALHGGTWSPAGAGTAGPPQEASRVPLAGVELSTPTRLWTAIRAPGAAEPGPETLLVNQRPLLRVAVEHVFRGFDEEDLGRALEGLVEETREFHRNRLEHPPDPLPHFTRHGVRAGLEEILPVLPDFFSSDAPLLEKAAVEELLAPLAYADVALQGSGYAPAYGLRALRQLWLPDGGETTLRAPRPLGPPFDSQEGVPPPLYLFPSEAIRKLFESGVDLEGSNLGAFSSDIRELTPQYERFRAQGYRTRSFLRLDRLPHPGEAMELEIKSSWFTRRFFLELFVNGKGPLFLWSHEADDSRWNLEEVSTTSYHRVPAELFERGANQVEIAIDDWPGQGGHMNYIKVYRLALRAGTPR